MRQHCKKHYSKPIACLVLILTILASSGVLAVYAGISAASFADVDKADWAYADISKLAEASIISGDKIERPPDAPAGASATSDEKPVFRPDDYLLREECSVIIMRLFNLLKIKYAFDIQETVYRQSFIDVSEDRWSFAYIEAVKSFMTGYAAPGGGMIFEPEKPALRGDFICALVRLIGNENRYVNFSILEKYVDHSEIPNEWMPYIAVAIEKSVLVGDDDRRLRLNEPVARREACALIIRAFKGVVDFPNPS